MLLQLQSFFGLLVLLLLCWVTGSRDAIKKRVVIGGITLQFVIALLLIKLPQTQAIFLTFNRMLLALEEATRAGTSFVFGYLGGGPTPFITDYPQNNFVLAFQALPLILVISALSALLFYWRILPMIVKGFTWLLQKVLGISGPLGVGATANIFLGMVEAPLLIRPYLLKLHRGELFALMVCGMATVAGTVLVLYASILTPVIPNALGHIMTASLISAPAALTLASLYCPWSEQADVTAEFTNEYDGPMDAITVGTGRGLQLWLNIVAMLLVLVALVSLSNQILHLLPDFNGTPLSLERIFGWLFAPLAWLTGIPWNEALLCGQLLGTKVILNELVAFLNLSALGPDDLSERSRLLISYAICGFANLGSLGIMVGGLCTMVPERRSEIISMGVSSVWVGLLATLLTASVVGTMI